MLLSLAAFGSLDVLGVNLLDGAAFLLLVEALALGLLLGHVHIQGEADLLFNDGLGLGLFGLGFAGLAGFSRFAGGLGLDLTFFAFLKGESTSSIFAPVALSMAALLVTTSAATGTVLTVVGVCTLTRLTLETRAVGASEGAGLVLSIDECLLAVDSGGDGSPRSVASAATTTIATARFSFRAFGTTSTAATFATTASASVATATATTAALATSLRLIAVLDTFKLLGALDLCDGGLGHLDGNLFLGGRGLGCNGGSLGLLGNLFFISECSESVLLHNYSSQFCSITAPSFQGVALTYKLIFIIHK